MAELPTTTANANTPVGLGCSRSPCLFLLTTSVVTGCTTNGYWLYDQLCGTSRSINSDATHMHMLRSTMLVTLLSPSAAFQLGQPQVRAPRPTAPRLSPVVAADKPEKHATVIFLRHGQSA